MRWCCNLGAGAALALMCTLPQSASFAQSVEEAAEEAPDYAAMARESVEGAYATFALHHPGMYNPFDPEFGARLAQARDEALAFAETVEDNDGHFLAVRKFSQSLQDGHARASIGYNGRGALWPGFHTVWRGEALVVSSESENGPPVGSALLGCDGRDANSLIEEEAFIFGGRPGEAGQWWSNAPDLFARVQPLVRGEPQTCTFLTPEGSEQELALQWEMMPREEGLRAYNLTDRLPVGLTEPREGIYLVSLPTFSPDEEQQANYETMFAELASRIDELSHARAIVLDLRWNGGGSSSWSQLLAEQLWGEEALAWRQAEYFRDTEVWYLADEGNIAHFGELEGFFRERGNDLIADFAQEAAADLAGARENGETFFKKHVLDEEERDAPFAEPRSLPPVYVITEGNCASACLDAVDTFTLFENTRLIGAPTSGDTEYLEVRRQPALFGSAYLTIPTKIWVNRPRGSGEVYHPDILVTDLEWSTDIFLDHIERDLESQ